MLGGKRNSGFILSDNRVLEDNRLDPVQIRSVSVADGKATIRLGNVSKMTRLHVYATRFVPHWDGFAALDVGGVPSPYTMRLSKKRSLYVEEREIGEEYRYVLDRRYAAKYAGNMLARPGLILNPWSVRKTDTARQNAAQGGEYDRASDDMLDSKRAGKGRGSSGGAMVDYANLDFLGSNSLLWANLKPDEKGIAVVDLKDLSGQQRLHVYALDPWNVAYRPVALPAVKLETRELRMARALDAKTPFSEQKLITSLAKGEEFKLGDVTTSKVQLYDSLASVHTLLSTLSSNSNLTCSIRLHRDCLRPFFLAERRECLCRLRGSCSRLWRCSRPKLSRCECITKCSNQKKAFIVLFLGRSTPSAGGSYE